MGNKTGTTKPDYRLRVYQPLAQVRTFVLRESGRVRCISGKEAELPLADLVGDEAAELRFALLDASCGEEAAERIRTAMIRLWGDGLNTPSVEVLP